MWRQDRRIAGFIMDHVGPALRRRGANGIYLQEEAASCGLQLLAPQDWTLHRNRLPAWTDTVRDGCEGLIGVKQPVVVGMATLCPGGMTS